VPRTRSQGEGERTQEHRGLRNRVGPVAGHVRIGPHAGRPDGRVGAVARIAVVGPSGAGKSTVARALAASLDVAYLELDGLFHQAGWTELDPWEFRRRVDAFVSADAWVVDGNYARSRDLVMSRADTVLWLRVSRWLVMRQIVRRTAGRVLLRRELWNGNRESLRNVLSRDPERSIVTWAWRMHATYDDEYGALLSTAPISQRWIVLEDRRQVHSFLQELPQLRAT
jgi:adenylate kinase family enzyme